MSEWINVEDELPVNYTPVLMAYDIGDGEPLIVGHFILNKDNKWQWVEECPDCNKYFVLDEGWKPVKWTKQPEPPEDM